jgi:hypothetical protein
MEAQNPEGYGSPVGSPTDTARFVVEKGYMAAASRSHLRRRFVMATTSLIVLGAIRNRRPGLLLTGAPREVTARGPTRRATRSPATMCRSCTVRAIRRSATFNPTYLHYTPGKVEIQDLAADSMREKAATLKQCHGAFIARGAADPPQHPARTALRRGSSGPTRSARRAAR